MGFKLQTESDYVGLSLEFERYYSSASHWRAVGLGPNWRHSFSKKVVYSGNNGGFTAAVHRPRGNVHYFADDGTGVWAADVDVKFTLQRLLDAQGTPIGWSVRDADGTLETYGPDGSLIAVTLANGLSRSFEHVDGLLVRVVDHLGRALEFSYDRTPGRRPRIAAMTLPDGRQVRYAYDASGMLQRVSAPHLPDEVDVVAWREYVYGEGLENKPQLLTGIIDELGQRKASWAYDTSDRAVLSVHGPVGSFVDRVEVAYNTSGTTTFRKFYSPTQFAETTYSFVVEHGVAKLDTVTEPCDSCGETTAGRSYDVNGFLNQAADFVGNITTYINDNEGNVVSRTYALGSSSQRTEEIDWHPLHRKPVMRRTRDAVGNEVARWTATYNSRGQMVTSTLTDPSTGSTRSTTTHYCEQADVDQAGSTCPVLGLIKSIDGPRADVADVTTFAYYSGSDESGCDAGGACHRKGDLHTITNALGHVTTYRRYDRDGRVRDVEDANGIATELTYHPRGWLAARTVKGATAAQDATTRFEYNAVGNVTRTTQPDGAWLDYTYDAAHRLIAVSDNLGNRVDYTLDAAGNRAAEDTSDPSGAVTRSLSREFDQLGRLDQQLDSQSRATSFDYDANGNQTATIDALGVETRQEYDPLNRLKRTIQDYAGLASTTGLAYDALDRLAEVTDPNGLVTRYTYNAFGDLVTLESPDTGTATYTYDAGGNRTGTTDARGITATYTYDALNRVTSISYPTASLDVQFNYDAVQPGCAADEAFAKGRLTGMVDQSGETRWCYDRRGNVTQTQQRTRVGTSDAEHHVAYDYNAADAMVGLTYPSGTEVEYGRDAAGRITAVTVDGLALVTAVDYLPFGPLREVTYAGGHVQYRRHDGDYRSLGVDSSGGGLELRFELDALGNPSSLLPYPSDGSSGGDGDGDGGTEPGATSTVPRERYAYDTLSRLVRVETGDGTLIEGFGYDATGNRSYRDYIVAGTGTDGGGDGRDGGGTPPPPSGPTPARDDYAYAQDSHRLLSVAGATRSYDAVGNTTSLPSPVDGQELSASYDDRNRLASVHSVTTLLLTNTYNGRGERVIKQAGAEAIRYVYDTHGQLLGEYSLLGTPIREYLWLDDLPIGVVQDGVTYAIESDHLGTPRRVFDLAGGSTVWRWRFEGNAFGTATAESISDQDSGGVDLPLRFPGQYYDVETGLHYNYFRDYEPSTGRYVESDPMGLKGGIDSYAYVGGDPITSMDPLGLHKGDKWWGRTNREFQRWFHQCWKQPGDPDANREEIEEAYEEWISRGSPTGGKCFGSPRPVPAPAPPDEEPACGENCQQALKVTRDIATGAIILIWFCITAPFAA